MPASRVRQGFTFLEKHKDYVLRAKDYNRKKNELKTLRLKAALRNDDEFSFGMVKSKVKGNVHSKTETNTPTGAEINRMKRQDMNLVRMRIESTEKQLEKRTASFLVAFGHVESTDVPEDKREEHDRREDELEDLKQDLNEWRHLEGELKAHFFHQSKGAKVRGTGEDGAPKLMRRRERKR